MSTVSVTNVKNASSSVNNAVTTSGGDLTNAAGVSFMGGSKNLLYNGAMQVAQRGTSTTGITTSGYYTADRWQLIVDGLGTWTQDLQNDAPTGSGFRRSYRVLCTTADASPAATDMLIFRQQLEGQDCQRIAKGTSSAQQLTLSFWVKSNVTGTYVLQLLDGDNNRHVAAQYSVSASGTWEKKTITFPADTTGAFDNDNGDSFRIHWWLGAGSNRTTGTLRTTWTSLTTADEAVGQTNLAAATNNYWQVTGVQLEVGPVATSFEFKSYGQELRECQRYYYLHASGVAKAICMISHYSATSASGVVPLPVTMRTEPALVVASGTNYYVIERNGGVDYVNSFTSATSSTTAARIYNDTEVSGTAGNAGWAYANNASASIAFNSEM